MKEVVQRFKSQTQRMEKLRGLDEDLRKNIATEQEKKKVLSEQYGHCGKYLCIYISDII